MTTTLALARTSIRVFSIAALMACTVPIAQAADWPTFKPGNWTFDRTMTGEGAAAKKVSTSKCTDPTADQKEQQAMLAKAGASSRRSRRAARPTVTQPPARWPE